MQNPIHLELGSRCGSPGGGGFAVAVDLPEWTSGDCGVVCSMKEWREENQASYGIGIGDVRWHSTADVSLSPNLRSDYKSCLGSKLFSTVREVYS